MNNYSNAKIAFGLTSLMKINEKRIKYYKTALEKSDDVDLILWFNRYASHLQVANNVLNQWLANYEKPRNVKHNPATLTSHWDHIKDIFILNRRNSLLQHCEMLERNALKIYRTAIALSFIPSVAIIDIQEQIDDIEEALLTLKTLNSSQSRQLQVA